MMHISPEIEKQLATTLTGDLAELEFLKKDAAFITGTDLLIDGGVIAAIESGRYTLNIR